MDVSSKPTGPVTMSPNTSNNKGELILESWVKKDSKWLREAKELGLTPVIVGNDLVKYNDDGSTTRDNDSAPAYLGLLFATADIWSVGTHKDGLPLRKEFLEDLQDWTWSDEAAHEIFLKSHNVKLNIDGYYQANQSLEGDNDNDLSIKIDVSKLLSGNSQSDEGNSSVLAVSCGGESNLEDASVSHAGYDSTLTMDLSGQPKLWILADLDPDKVEGNETNPREEEKAHRGPGSDTTGEASGVGVTAQKLQDESVNVERGEKPENKDGRIEEQKLQTPTESATSVKKEDVKHRDTVPNDSSSDGAKKE